MDIVLGLVLVGSVAVMMYIAWDATKEKPKKHSKWIFFSDYCCCSLSARLLHGCDRGPSTEEARQDICEAHALRSPRRCLN